MNTLGAICVVLGLFVNGELGKESKGLVNISLTIEPRVEVVQVKGTTEVLTNLVEKVVVTESVNDKGYKVLIISESVE